MIGSYCDKLIPARPINLQTTNSQITSTVPLPEPVNVIYPMYPTPPLGMIGSRNKCLHKRYNS
jgi:hypothetical protein